MVTVRVVLLALALLSFGAAACDLKARVNLVALGLFLWVLTLFITV